MARERKFTTEELFQATEELLLQYNYEGFHFSLLAEQLKISRGAIYKYYENKEELITEYMIYKMKDFLTQLSELNNTIGFENQLDELINLIFANSELHQLIDIGSRVPAHTNKKIQQNKKRLEELHIEMYHQMNEFIELGKSEEKINPNIPEPIILGYIFQSVAIPNHFKIPREKWVNSIKEIICHGIFTRQ